MHDIIEKKGNLLTYNLGNNIMAFTTNRIVGRERDAVVAAVKELAAERDTNIANDIKLVRPHQTHDTRVFPLTKEFFSLSEGTQQMLLNGIDAVMSNEPGVIVGISTADCIPLIIYDPVHHAAAAVHAGWRGTVQRIAMKAVEEMTHMYHTVPADCKAVIGPGISLESFEVGDEVYEAFASLCENIGIVQGKECPISDYAERFPLMTRNNDCAPTRIEDANPTTEKWHIDLKAVNKRLLMVAGLKEENISLSDICTFTCSEYFSARREENRTHTAEKCGRNLTAFIL